VTALVLDLLPFALGLVLGWLARQWTRDGYVEVGPWRYPPEQAAGSGGETDSQAESPAPAQPGPEPREPGLARLPASAAEEAGDEGSGHADLAREVRTLATSFEKQSTQLGALRADFKLRLENIEAALQELGRPAGNDAVLEGRDEADGLWRREAADALPLTGEDRDDGQADDGGDAWLRGVETHSVPMLDLGGPSAAPPPSSGVPVEVREGMLILSHSLPPVAYAVSEGKGLARVFLNESVEINEFALPKWQAFFEMRGARPYATYRTVRAAQVKWDGERGAPINPGVAEAV
jgi:hypothetical protein